MDGKIVSVVAAPDVMTRTVDALSTATNLTEVTAVVARAVRELTGADGATFVLREDDQCFYADENAIGPLWKGSRFPLTACVSGWAMLHRETVIIPDIYSDDRVPIDAYRATFVASLCMTPVRASDPIGAIGAYWAESHVPDAEQVRRLEVLANTTAVTLENLELRSAITRRSAERDQMAARADELDATMHSLVHDLRGPLSAMMGFAELITEDRTAPTSATYAHAVLRAGERMSAQIERMLSIYRITAAPLAPQRLDLSAIARGIADELLARNRDRDIDIRVEDHVVVCADPVLVQLALENLLGNAVKYTGKKSTAHIVLRQVDAGSERVLLELVDDGDGFDPSDASRLFRPLTRLHSQEEFPGTGLGLASAARIVELHGGAIHADGRKGVGATFTFSLPAAGPAPI